MQPITIRIKKRKLRAIKMLIAGLLILLGLLWMDSRLRPIVDMMSIYQAQLLATRAVNDAVLETIEAEQLSYENLIRIARSTDGTVSSISTDMVEVNRIKAIITNKVSDTLLEESSKQIDIPLGTLLGNQFLTGRGPMIPFKMQPTGYVHVDMYNDFKSAGINQTLHQIMMTIELRVSAIMPLYSITADLSNDLCIAQTVIVGDVPQAFTDINGDQSDAIGLHNDYEATIPNSP